VPGGGGRASVGRVRRRRERVLVAVERDGLGPASPLVAKRASDAEARGALRDVIVGEDADGAGDAAAEELDAVLGEDAEQKPAASEEGRGDRASIPSENAEDSEDGPNDHPDARARKKKKEDRWMGSARNRAPPRAARRPKRDASERSARKPRRQARART
jgi:hypothetical protein